MGVRMGIRVRGLFAAVVALGLSGCATTPTLTPSELNAHADQYDGKKVRVCGWVVIQFEEYWISDSQASSESKDSKASECVSYLGPIRDRTRGRMEILYGTFWKDFGRSLDVVDLGACNLSGLDVEWQRAIAQR